MARKSKAERYDFIVEPPADRIPDRTEKLDATAQREATEN